MCFALVVATLSFPVYCLRAYNLSSIALKIAQQPADFHELLTIVMCVYHAKKQHTHTTHIARSRHAEQYER